MRRGLAQQVGVFSAFVLAATALATLGSGGVSQATALGSETHAVRIPLPAPQGFRASTLTAPWESSNWSGYAVSAPTGTYTQAAGSWTVPAVIAPPNHPNRARQFSSTWVGIDGFNDGTLIQAGTEQDWADGSPFYQAWWEILPAAETPITTMTIQPGDKMTVTITQGTSNSWTIVVSDATTGQSFSTTKTYKGDLSSVEWIQERPTVGRRLAKLADDGTVDFDQALANGINPDFTVDDGGSMATKRGRVLSTPSGPNPALNGFAVAYGPTAPLAPPN
jgi:hypothetical protein